MYVGWRETFYDYVRKCFLRWNLFDKAAALCLDLTMTMKDGIFMGILLEYLLSLHVTHVPDVYTGSFIITTC